MNKGFFDVAESMNEVRSGYDSSDEEDGFGLASEGDDVRRFNSASCYYSANKDFDDDMAKAFTGDLSNGFRGETAQITQEKDKKQTRGFFSVPQQQDEDMLSPSDEDSSLFDCLPPHDPLRKNCIVPAVLIRDKNRPLDKKETVDPSKERRPFFEVHDSDAGLPTVSVSDGVMGLIQVSKLKEHFNIDTLKREFSILYSEDLKLNVSRYGSLISQDPENSDRKRYTNVDAFDHSRVILNTLPGEKHSDFINANWIVGEREDGSVDEHAFIATQGPLPQTFQDFWRMIWETNARFIVFLGKEIEKGMLKVDHYWPNVDPEKAVVHLPWENDPLFGSSHSFYGGYSMMDSENTGSVMSGPQMTITAVKEELIGISGVIKRTFLLAQTSNPGVTREVYQYQYGGWPDNGAPSSSEPIRNLVKELYNARGNDPAPIVVHCSAGVGRTGAFCTIYTHILRILWYIRRRQDIIPCEVSPMKKPRDDGSLRTSSHLIPDKLRRSGSLLKTNLTSQKFYREDSTPCSPSMVSPLRVSASSLIFDEEEPLMFNIYKTVLDLRRCRSGMVQNLDQYMFCYKAIIDELRSSDMISSDEETEEEDDDEKDGRKSNSEIMRPSQQKVEPNPSFSPMAIKMNPFSNRQSLLTSIDLGMLNTTPSQKPAESCCFDAEFHPSPPQEGSSLAKSAFLTQSCIGPIGPSVSSVHTSCHTNPVLLDSRRHPPLRAQDSVHSGAGCSIPIRQKVQPLLNQSPTLVSKPLMLNDESRVAVILRPIEKRNTPSDKNDGSLSDNGGKERRGPSSDLLTRSAISPSFTVMSTSPPRRNPVLLGRTSVSSSHSSPGEISSPA